MNDEYLTIEACTICWKWREIHYNAPNAVRFAGLGLSEVNLKLLRLDDRPELQVHSMSQLTNHIPSASISWRGRKGCRLDWSNAFPPRLVRSWTSRIRSFLHAACDSKSSLRGSAVRIISLCGKCTTLFDKSCMTLLTFYNTITQTFRRSCFVGFEILTKPAQASAARASCGSNLESGTMGSDETFFSPSPCSVGIVIRVRLTLFSLRRGSIKRLGFAYGMMFMTADCASSFGQ